MKKVLLALGGNDFSKGAFEFARQLNELSPILLSGFFLPEIANPPLELHVSTASGDESEKAIAENVRRFTGLCELHRIEYRVHLGSYEQCMPQLIKETRFSDLFIASSEIFFQSYNNEDIQYHLDRAIHQAECPMVIVPEIFDFPENIIFAFDGSPSAVYAIKQFAYLFPELCDRSALVVYANDDVDSAIPNKDVIDELTATHFKNIQSFKLVTDPGKYFKTWLANKEKPLLVTGAGSRTRLSEIMKKSFGKEIIAEHKTPVFIAHC